MILSSFWRRILGMSDKALIRAALGAGSGDVSGPASATDGNVATFDGATGKLIKDAGTPSTSLLLRPDIVGTVSQSGGVPTGAIVERGSNANGEYVRWADGTQICTGSYSYSDITTPFGSFFATAGVITITPPATFSVVQGMFAGDQSSNNVWAMCQQGSFNLRMYASVSIAGARTGRYTMFGRWF